MYQINAACIEFVDGGNTIWVHSPIGATILRIKTLGKITVNGECENICSHSDMIVKENIEICLSDDTKVVSDLEKLKQTFDSIDVNYIEIDDGNGYCSLHTCTDEEKKANKLEPKTFRGRDIFFEFFEGKLASVP
jgi:hypothetical protein